MQNKAIDVTKVIVRGSSWTVDALALKTNLPASVRYSVEHLWLELAVNRGKGFRYACDNFPGATVDHYPCNLGGKTTTKSMGNDCMVEVLEVGVASSSSPPGKRDLVVLSLNLPHTGVVQEKYRATATFRCENGKGLAYAQLHFAGVPLYIAATHGVMHGPATEEL